MRKSKDHSGSSSSKSGNSSNSTAARPTRSGNKATKLLSAAVCCGSSQHRPSIDDPRDVKLLSDESNLPNEDKSPPIVAAEDVNVIVSVKDNPPDNPTSDVPAYGSETFPDHNSDSSLGRLVKFGPMKFFQPVLSVLLIFPQNDNQGSVLREACRRLGCTIHMAGDLDAAMNAYLSHRHNVVVIDTRKTAKAFDHWAVCRTIRSANFGHEAVIVALIGKAAEGNPILNLLRNGYSRHFVENSSVIACYNELLSLEHSDVRQQLRLRSAVPLFTALELCSDAVEVSDAEWNILYINSAHERLFGYSAEDIVDKKAKDFVFNCPPNSTDLQKNIDTILRRGRLWEGHQFVQTKTGEIIRSQCHCMGISCSGKELQYIVTVRHAEDVSTPPAADGSKPGRPGGKSPSVITDRSSRQPSLISATASRRPTISSTKGRAPITPASEVMTVLAKVSEISSPEVRNMLKDVIDKMASIDIFRPYSGPENEVVKELIDGLMNYRDPDQPDNLLEGPARKNSVTLATPLERDEVCIDLKAPETAGLVKDVLMWEFDVFLLEKKTSRPMVYVCLSTLDDFKACDLLNTDERTLTKFLVTLESKYRQNPYHNNTHAADVVQAMAFFLHRSRTKEIFDDLQCVAGLIAAAAHDLDHVGRTNAFLINASHQLAVLYNDHAVLENHHASLLFQLASNDEKINIFTHLPNTTYRSLRQMIIDMILATEMSKHFEHVNRFVSVSGPRQSPKVGDQQPTVAMQIPNELYKTPENRLIILRMMIKCADVSNPTRERSVCIEWAKRISEEYFQQTDEEKKLGLPVVMPVFDRRTCRLPSSQTNFIDFFLMDMFEAFHDFLDIPELMGNLEENYEYWKSEDRKYSLSNRASSLHPSDAQTISMVSCSNAGGAFTSISKNDSAEQTDDGGNTATVPTGSTPRRPSLPDTANIKSV